MADDDIPLSDAPLPAPEAPGNFTEAVPPGSKNPFKAPSGDAPLSERFRLNFEQGRGLRGAAEAAGAATVVDAPAAQDVPPEVENFAAGRPFIYKGKPFVPRDTQEAARAQLEQIQNDAISYQTLPWSGNPVEAAAAVGGALTGGATTPENLFLPAVRVGTPAWRLSHPFLSEMIALGLGQAAVQTAVDPIQQAAEVRARLRAEYDATQTALMVPMGFAFGAGFKVLETLPSAYRATVRTFEERMGRRQLEPELRPPVDPEPTPTVTPPSAPRPAVPVEGLAEPPPQQGMARLYRVETPDAPEGNVKFSRSLDNVAETLDANARVEEPKISFIDVPETTALARAVDENTVTLPADMVQGRQVLEPSAEPRSSLERDSSWVIREKETGNVVMETFDKKKVDALNTEKYEAIPIQEHLAQVNRAARSTTETVKSEKPQTPKEAAEREKAMERLDELDVEKQTTSDKVRRAEIDAEIKSIESKFPEFGKTVPRQKGMAGGRSPAATVADVGQRGVPTNAMPGTTPKVESLPDVARRIASELDLTVRKGGAGQGNVASFNVQNEIIRLQKAGPNAFIDFMHEVGHYIQTRVGRPLEQFIEREKASFASFNNLRTSNLSDSAPEGYAEFVAGYVTNHAGLVNRAPGLLKRFQDLLDVEAPELRKVLDDARAAFDAWNNSPSVDVAASMIVTRSEIKDAWKEAGKAKNDPLGRSPFAHWFSNFYTAVINEQHPIKQAQDFLLKELRKAYGGNLPDLSADQLPAVLAQQYKRGAPLTGLADALYGIGDVLNGKDHAGPAILDIWKRIAGDGVAEIAKARMERFDAYLVAVWHHDLETMRMNGQSAMDRPLTAMPAWKVKQTIDDVERLHPEWKAEAEGVYAYLANLRRKEFEHGMISPTEFADSQRPEARRYVPARRDMRDITEGVAAVSKADGWGTPHALETLGHYARRGSDRDVLSPMESILLRTFTVNDQIAHNTVVRAMRDLVRQVGGREGATIAEEIPNNKIRSIDIDLENALYSAARQNGWTPQDARQMAKEAVSEIGNNRAILYSSQAIKPGNKPIIFGWEAGERYALQLTDGPFGQALQQAFDSIGPRGAGRVVQGAGLLTDMLIATSQTLRAGATGTPTFAVKNAIRDAFMQFLLLPEVKLPGVSTAKGLTSLASEDRFWRMYMATEGIRGGATANALSESSRVAAALQAAGIERQNILSFGGIKNALAKIEFSETGGRVGIFRAVYEANKAMGRSERYSLMDAAHKARDFVDYGRFGSKMEMTMRIVPFLNANIQGMDKFFRTYGGALFKTATTQAEAEYQQRLRVAISTRASVIAAMSAAISYQYADDPVYQSIPLQMRSQYWIFRLPFLGSGVYDMAGGGKVEFPEGIKGAWVVIPKPWEPASIFNLAERAQQFIHTSNPDELVKFMRSLQYSFSLPLSADNIPVWKTISGLNSNYNSFFDVPIVGQAYQGVAPHLQANEYTGWFYKALAGGLDKLWNSKDAHDTLKKVPVVGGVLASLWSPMESQYMMQGFFGDVPRELGGIGGMINSIASGERFKVDDIPVARAFLRDKISSGEPAREIYNQVGQHNGRLTTAVNSYKKLIEQGDALGAQQYFDHLDDAQRDYVRLKTSEAGPLVAALNPMERSLNLNTVVRNIRAGLLLDGGLPTFNDPTKRIKLEPGLRDVAIQTINEYATVEGRNALILQGVRGYANLEVTPTAPYLDMLKAISPELAQEFSAQLAAKKVMPLETLQRYWPEAQRRLRIAGDRATMAQDLKGIGLEAAAQGYVGGGIKSGRGAVDSAGVRVKRGKRQLPELAPEGGTR